MPSTLEAGSSAPLRQTQESNMKPELSFNHKTTHSWSTTDGENSSSNGDDTDSYQGLGQMDDPYMYPSPFVIKNTFIGCESAEPSFEENPASKVFAGIKTGADEFSTIPVSVYDGDLPAKNTFVHFPVEHISLDLFEERRTKSCPCSGVELVGGEDNVAASFDSAVETGMGSVQSTSPQCDLYLPCAVIPVGGHFMPMTWVDMEPTQPCRAVISLVNALPETKVGFVEMPSIGSVGHWNGSCKPCAFMARGCTSGVNCPFCHLCDVNEKKRRRKDKIAFMRELRRWKKEQPGCASGVQHR